MRADYRSAILACLVANAFGGKSKHSKYEPGDFFASLETKRRRGKKASQGLSMEKNGAEIMAALKAAFPIRGRGR